MSELRETAPDFPLRLIDMPPVVNLAIDRLDRAGGLVHTADLEWPLFDPEEVTTMIEYVGRIGATMAGRPREGAVKDAPLQLYRKDFEQAEPARVAVDLYHPNHKGPLKGVVNINVWQRGFTRGDYPGDLPFSTGLAVPEDIYEELVKHGGYFSNSIDNKTRRNRRNHPIPEEVVDLAGESDLYGQIDKHEVLEARSEYLIGRHAILLAVHRNIENNSARRITNLESYRLEAMADILEMFRVACNMRGYGANQTRATFRSVASNLHRSPGTAEWWRTYTSMAMRYNREIQGKVEQSIHVCMQEISKHRIHAINNLGRVYTDDGSIQYETLQP